MKRAVLIALAVVVCIAITSGVWAAPVVNEITLAQYQAISGTAAKVFETRARYGGTGYRVGLRNLSNGSYDVTAGTGYTPWPNGSPWDFTINYDLSDVSVTLDGLNPIARAATGTVGNLVIKANSGTSTTVNGSVELTNLLLNGESVGSFSSMNAAGEKFLLINGVDLSSGLTLSGKSTLSWATAPSQEGLKFEVVAFQPSPAVPEPSSCVLALTGGGLGCLLPLIRRRK